MAVSTMPNPKPQDSFEIGTIIPFAGSTVPEKWIPCDGALISRTTYNLLFEVLGTVWGGGDGETTFAAPDLRGRTIIGVGENATTGHTAHTFGTNGGEEKHTLSTGELASHNHWWDGHTNTPRDTGGAWTGWVDGRTSWCASTGSNWAHNTMMPYQTCNYIIYAGV